MRDKGEYLDSVVLVRIAFMAEDWASKNRQYERRNVQECQGIIYDMKD